MLFIHFTSFPFIPTFQYTSIVFNKVNARPIVFVHVSNTSRCFDYYCDLEIIDDEIL